MKQYPKKYNDVSHRPSQKVINRIGSSYGSSVDDLISTFRGFYRDSHLYIWQMFVKQVWLSHQFLYSGQRRVPNQNGFNTEKMFSFFMAGMVGISQKPIVASILFTGITSYFKDFFPDFLSHNPFDEPEYFAYPYKHITLDHMAMVYQCHDRLAMLAYADDRSMSFFDFRNWATNHVLSYNEDVGDQIYRPISRNSVYPFYISKKK